MGTTLHREINKLYYQRKKPTSMKTLLLILLIAVAVESRPSDPKIKQTSLILTPYRKHHRNKRIQPNVDRYTERILRLSRRTQTEPTNNRRVARAMMLERDYSEIIARQELYLRILCKNSYKLKICRQYLRKNRRS